jgi:hypothetical protein
MRAGPGTLLHCRAKEKRAPARSTVLGSFRASVGPIVRASPERCPRLAGRGMSLVRREPLQLGGHGPSGTSDMSALLTTYALSAPESMAIAKG